MHVAKRVYLRRWLFRARRLGVVCVRISGDPVGRRWLKKFVECIGDAIRGSGDKRFRHFPTDLVKLGQIGRLQIHDCLRRIVLADCDRHRDCGFAAVAALDWLSHSGGGAQSDWSRDLDLRAKTARSGASRAQPDHTL